MHQREDPGKPLQVSPGLVILLLLLIAVTGFFWWQRTGIRPEENSAFAHTAMTVKEWLLWKGVYTILIALTVYFCLRAKPSVIAQGMLMTVVMAAVLIEPYILFSRWWFPVARSGAGYSVTTLVAKFLAAYPPDQHRIYVSWGYGVKSLPRDEAPNLTAARGLHAASGYEPLMSQRYSQAFGNGGSFYTPILTSPSDPQLFSPRWQVMDLLNVRFLIEYKPAPDKIIGRHGARFADAESAITINPGETVALMGTNALADALSLVSVMTNSADLADDAAVAEVLFHTSRGIVTREIVAGRDTAEWAHERPDVRSGVRHRLATIFDRRAGDQSDTFPAYRYQTIIRLDERLKIPQVEIRNITAQASLIISRAALYDSQGSNLAVLTRQLPSQWAKVYEDDASNIYENRRQFPRAWLTTCAEAISAETALHRIRGDGADAVNFREVALLETAPERLTQFSCSRAENENEARFISYRADHQVIETNAGQTTALVVSEINWPGWEATIDGAPAEVITANYLLRGVIVPAGKHRVEMRYNSPAMKTGLLISTASLLVLAGVGLSLVVRKKSL